jgi:hypothetical protein
MFFCLGQRLERNYTVPNETEGRASERNHTLELFDYNLDSLKDDESCRTSQDKFKRTAPIPEGTDWYSPKMPDGYSMIVALFADRTRTSAPWVIFADVYTKSNRAVAIGYGDLGKDAKDMAHIIENLRHGLLTNQGIASPVARAPYVVNSAALRPLC